MNYLNKKDGFTFKGFTLSKRSIDDLDSLASKLGLSKSSALDLLIQCAESENVSRELTNQLVMRNMEHQRKKASTSLHYDDVAINSNKLVVSKPIKTSYLDNRIVSDADFNAVVNSLKWGSNL